MSLLPCCKLTFPMRPITRQRRFSSVNKAGVTSDARTSMVPHATGSVMRGRSSSASIGRSPSCRHIRAYSCRTSSLVGMRRPIDADAAEVVEAGRDGAVASAEGHKQVDPQPSDGSQVREARGPACQFGQARFGFHQRAGEELAFRPLQLEREGQLVPALPRIARQQRGAGGEIGQRRCVGGRRLRARWPPRRLNSASCSRSSPELIKATPRLS